MRHWGQNVVTVRWASTKKQTTSFVFRRHTKAARCWRAKATPRTSRDAEGCWRARFSRREELVEEGEVKEAEPWWWWWWWWSGEGKGRRVRGPSLLLSVSHSCTRSEGEDGADGVDGAHHGELHHVLPGDPTWQRLPFQRDHREPGQDPGPCLRRGARAQGRDS